MSNSKTMLDELDQMIKNYQNPEAISVINYDALDDSSLAVE